LSTPRPAIDELAPTDAIASASRGGDILFLEACRTRNIPTTIVLPFSPDEFERRSVAAVEQSDWVARFRALIAATPPEQLIVLDLNDEPDLIPMVPAISRCSSGLRRPHLRRRFCSRCGTVREAMDPAVPPTWSSEFAELADE
jgi:hypothetical protein